MAMNLSVSTVIRFFDMLAYDSPTELPQVLSIDEFKGNTGKEKYQVIITNPADGTILDILIHDDMWKPYAELSETYLKKPPN